VSLVLEGWRPAIPAESANWAGVLVGGETQGIPGERSGGI
jgi:hypothetical protein